MYVKVDELKAVAGTLVVEVVKWPSIFSPSSSVIIPAAVNSSYDNGRELYITKVIDSQEENIKKGDYVAVDIYFGVHVPLVEQHRKVKLIPASGVVLSGKEKLTIMSDLIKMTPGEGRILIKLRKKENKTAGGLYIPTEVSAQNPTAQDVRFGDVIHPGTSKYVKGDLLVIEAFMGKEVYKDSEDFAYRTCYVDNILAVVEEIKK